MQRFLILVLALPAIALAEQKEARTPRGDFRWKDAPDSKLAAVAHELSPAERASLDRDADRAAPFIAKYVPAAERRGDLLERLDLAFSGWLRAPQAAREPTEEVVRVTGAAYGRYCIQRLGLRWATVRDQHGTETALVRDVPATRAFPFSSIQQRIEDGKCEFFVALYVSLEHTIKDAEKA